MVSHSPYIHPELLGPLSSSSDGRSPLELLEKTCYNIGLTDPPKNKATILPATDKSEKPSTSLPASSHKKPSSHIATQNGSSMKSPSNSFTTSSFLDHKRKASRSCADDESPVKSSRLSASSPTDNKDSRKIERSSSAGEGKIDENANKTELENRVSSSADDHGRDSKASGSRPTSAPNDSTGAPRSSASTSTTQPVPPTIPSMPNSSRSIPTFPTTSIGSFPPFSAPHFSGASFNHGLPFPMGPSTFPGLPHPSTYGSINPLAAAAAAIGHGAGYPRVCTDPTCKSCPSSFSGLAGMSGVNGGRPCPAGCTQCAVGHPDLSAWLSYSSLLHGFPTPGPTSLFPGLGSSLASMAGSVSTPSLPGTLPGAALSVSASGSSSGSPLCNWVTPEGVCGKRFSTPDELLIHVQTHTKTDGNRQPNNPLLNLSSPPTSNSFSGRLSPRSMYLSSLQQRFHPYPKLSPTPTGPSPHLPFVPPGFGANGYSAALSAALCAGQRLPGSLPHA